MSLHRPSASAALRAAEADAARTPSMLVTAAVFQSAIGPYVAAVAAIVAGPFCH